MNQEQQPLAEADELLRRVFGNVDSLQVIEGGFTSEAFLFRHNGADFVLRLSEYEQNFKKDELAAAHRSADLPIPKVVSIGRNGKGYYAISERAFGRPIIEMSERDMRGALPSLLRACDGLRLIDTTQSTGYGIWLANGQGIASGWKSFLLNENWAEPYVTGWKAVLDANPEARNAYDRAYKMLSDNVHYCPEVRHVVHGDLHNNILFDDKGLSAMFDWGSVAYGDFLYDLAWMTFWSPQYAATKHVNLRGEARKHYASIGLDVPNFEERMLCYELDVGLNGMRFQASAGHTADLAWTVDRLNYVMTGAHKVLAGAERQTSNAREI